MKIKPSLFAAATALTSLLLTTDSAFGAAASASEKTPLNLPKETTGSGQTHVAGGGSIVRTIVGLAIVIGVIYGLYWVLKQVKSSREEKAVGQGLAALATLPLGPNRSLQLIRTGRELVLVGVSEHGVTPVRSYSEDEAEAAGLLDLEDVDPVSAPRARNGNGNGNGGGVLNSIVDELRRRTVRR